MYFDFMFYIWSVYDVKLLKLCGKVFNSVKRVLVVYLIDVYECIVG